MILSDEDLRERIENPENIINLVKDSARPTGSLKVVDTNTTGVGDRGPEIPDLIRKLIANTANSSDETKTEIANVFGVGVPEVSKYSRGLVANRLDEELAEVANKSKAEKTDDAHNLALDSLVASLGIVKATLPDATDLKTAARIATDMSRIVEKLAPKPEDEKRTSTLVVIAMPQLKKENQFECIDV